MINPKIQEMLNLAASDVNRLRKAETCADARRAWVAFLEHSNRAINRLEGYSKRTSQHDKYKKLLKEEIWSSGLTKYMRAARNTHEHGVADTQIDDRFSERIVFPNGKMLGGIFASGTTADGQIVYCEPGPMEFEGSPGVRKISIKPTILLVPVEGRAGEWILPPIVPFEAEDEPWALAVARSYLEWVIGKVNTFA